MRCRSVVLALGMLALLGVPAAAQDTAETKADAPAQAPAERDATTAEVGFVAKARRWVEEHDLIDRLAPAQGVYARFGGMTTGSGFALGAGYRELFFGDRVFGDVSAALSTKLYKAVDAKARWAQFWGDRVELWSEFRYRDYPEEDYFGPGPDSSLDTRTSYAIESTDVIGRVLLKPMRWLNVGADLGYFNPNIGPGRDGALASIEQRFGDIEAPGLMAQPDFLHNTLFAEIDYRDHRGHPTRGGFYRAAFGTWEDVTLETFDHHRFDAEASQFFPVAPRQVFAARVGLSYVNNETGHRVPFYFLPYVGGSDTIRGFREFRFRDENILFLNAEYRIRVHKFVHVAPFFDAGEVRADWEAIGPRDMKTSYGIGIRGGTEDRIFIRMDIGTGGGEGTRFFFKFGPSF
jgi:outer membrane protein assembly factor BamA